MNLVYQNNQARLDRNSPKGNLPALVYQNDKRLKGIIQKYGCHYRCLQAIAELTIGKALKPDDINFLHTFDVADRGVLGDNCFCGRRLHKITEHAFKRLNSALGLRQVGSVQNGVPTDWSGRPLQPDADFRYVIKSYKTHLDTTHFVLYDAKGKELFDPYNSACGPRLNRIELVKQMLYNVVDA